MSNRLAIAAVTLTLRNLIQREVQQILGGARVTTVPLDRARDGNNDVDQVNLFLYQTAPNPALRNRGAQGRPPRAGEELWLSPLALNLHYLVTAYGADGNTANDHRLLGGAMKALHDHPLLSADDIRAALAESDLQNQIERIRITLESPSTEEMSKLWTTFQSQYRISASYQAAVVLIDSTRAAKTALPVLRRGGDDRGFPAVAAPFQSISAVTPPHPFPAARLGDELTISGTQLGVANVVVRFSNRRLDAPIEREPLPDRTENELRVRIGDAPDDAAAAALWVPGVYTASLIVKPERLPSWSTNEMPFALAPRITVAPTPVSSGDVLTVTPTPHLHDSQREHALLLLGDHQIPVRPSGAAVPPPLPVPPDRHFIVPRLTPGSYVARLRVDGVDSLPFILAGTPARLEFDPDQMVTIT
jgi:hypothetical protein